MPEATEPIHCFHCGEPVPAGTDYPIRYESEIKPACCRGCQAVAQTIIDSGNADYYRLRTDMPRTPEAALEELKQLKLYDLPEVQQSFVKTEGEVREANLILEGIVCAACVWLNERHLRQLPGVLAADINFSTHRARVRWDSGRIELSEILHAVQEIGYLAYPFDPGRQEELFRKERETAIRRLAIAGLGMMQVMMYAVPVYLADAGTMGLDLQALMRFASLILTTPVVFYSAWPFFQGAWRDLKLRRAGMDVPVALGVGSAYVASIYGTFTSSPDVYFDSVTMFIFFLLTGRFLEMNARKRSAEAAESLVKLIPAAATRLPHWPGGRDEELVAAVKLTPGDHVLIGPGDSFPADGTVAEGESSVDESLLTGESHPLAKHPGSTVIGGTINLASPLVIRVDKIGADTVLSGIVRLLDRALAEKPRLALLADRVASWFVLGLLAVAATVATTWYFVDPGRAFWITVSVLVVSCPCALALATPAALTAALGRLTRMGLLSTRGHALETLAHASDFVFDKTGTLTTGEFQLRACVVERGDRAAALALAAALEQGSTHPVATALREAAGPLTTAASQLRYQPGQGIEGHVDGRVYRLGTPAFVAAQAAAMEAGMTVVGLADADGPIAWFGLGDEVRPQAAELVARLKGMGMRLHLFSGDRPENVVALAHRLGIEDARGGMLPEDKLNAVKALQGAGAVVAMTGDGVNDAPVLAQAQVSVAIDQGAEAAQAAADMVLLSSELSRLADGVRVARKTQTIIKQNLAWSVLYNGIAIPAAAMGHVTPWLAGIGMSLSSLLVVLNAMRLSGYKGDPSEYSPATGTQEG
ncbi:cadmium-translocating P-type ATPase [Parasulfuritortus cantonensis]|uniref:Cadmium-translocating P-type ATPase n=1 Tax=Parasulfuritortus cantonensis TaxID=2528202 RepID=A0A4R1BGK9_9PROT|nr:heavy metal translocating P-type ATPase [Parasulfuritortus cantonensis]TCJ16297.1 cadmium-translocating P-type ATPase [Parasulfuritortus cantonensis]